MRESSRGDSCLVVNSLLKEIKSLRTDEAINELVIESKNLKERIGETETTDNNVPLKRARKCQL